MDWDPGTAEQLRDTDTLDTYLCHKCGPQDSEQKELGTVRSPWHAELHGPLWIRDLILPFFTVS